MNENQDSSSQPSIEALANKVAEDLDADVILLNGPLGGFLDIDVIAVCRKRQRRKNVLLLLITGGGSADIAYRITRCFQEKYERLILYVCGFCKSAGTFIAVGAHELIFSDHGQLGPIDIQMYPKDELMRTRSGLTVMSALAALHDKAFQAFEKYFLDMQTKSGGTITVKTSAQIATNLTTGLFAPIYGQIDPMHVGEAARSMLIAQRYGERLLGVGKNSNAEALRFLSSDYPSHGFVIDREEATRLFKQVREPNEHETALAEALGKLALVIEHETQYRFNFLSSEIRNDNVPDNDIQEEKEERPHVKTTETVRMPVERVAGTSREELQREDGVAEAETVDGDGRK